MNLFEARDWSIFQPTIGRDWVFPCGPPVQSVDFLLSFPKQVPSGVLSREQDPGCQFTL